MNYFKMLFFSISNMIYTVPTHALLPICNDILRFFGNFVIINFFVVANFHGHYSKVLI